MRPSTLRALERAAWLTRNDRLTEALRVAEPVILAADADEASEIAAWLTEHIDDFTGAGEGESL